jgi:hypothetical protein
MPTITLSTIRDRLDQSLGDYRGATITTGSGAGTIAVSSLADFPDSHFDEWWVEVTSGTVSGEVRQVSSFTSSGGSLVMRRAFSTAPGTATIKLHRYEPAYKDKALSDALYETFPALRQIVIDESLVSGNILKNGNFDQLISSDDWALSGGSSAVSTTRRYGKYSGLFVTSGVGEYLSQTWGGTVLAGFSVPSNEALDTLDGGNIRMKGWVMSASAGSIYAQFVTQNRDTGTGTTVSADTISTPAGVWTQYDESLSLSSDISYAQARIVLHKAGTYYLNRWRLYATTHEYTIPSVFTAPPTQVYISNRNADYTGMHQWTALHDWRVNNDNGVFKLQTQTPYAHGFPLRLVGAIPLVLPTSGSSTLPMGADDVALLCQYGAYLFYDRLAMEYTGKDRTQFQRMASRYLSAYERMPKPQPLATHLERY